MAISQTTALQARNAKHMQQAQQLEARIDAALENFPDGSTCVVDVENTVPVSVFNEVTALYTAAGWHFTVQVDFRGNRQISFEAS